jgi:uncharacterized protein (TIGR02001 family)
MKKTTLALAALALTSGSALAADLLNKKAPAAPVVVSPWDFTVGGGLTSNYLFRGISQSNNGPSGNVNAELRYTIDPTWQLYVGTAASSIKLTNQATSPSVEIDAIGGVRATVGNFTFDVGAIAYIYPYDTKEAGNFNAQINGAFWATNPTWYEGYGKVSYAVNDSLTFGINAFYTQSYLDFGSTGQYYSGTVKYTMGDFALSGEFGRQFLGRTDAAHDVSSAAHGLWKRDLPDYNYWNAGISYSYKLATLDLRYHGTDMSKTECGNITGKTNGSALNTAVGSQSKYCGTAVVGTISFALGGKDLK